MDAPEKTVTLVDFQGLIINQDPRNIPPGAAQVQVNCANYKVGELLIRHGTQLVSFDNG